MRFKRYPSLARAADALRKQGFSEEFILKDDVLQNGDSGRLYESSEVVIVEYHRFLPQGPDRNRVSIVFALETTDDKRGLLVATYNVFGKVNLLEFMDRVKIKSRRESMA